MPEYRCPSTDARVPMPEYRRLSTDARVPMPEPRLPEYRCLSAACLSPGESELDQIAPGCGVDEASRASTPAGMRRGRCSTGSSRD